MQNHQQRGTTPQQKASGRGPTEPLHMNLRTTAKRKDSSESTSVDRSVTSNESRRNSLVDMPNDAAAAEDQHSAKRQKRDSQASVTTEKTSTEKTSTQTSPKSTGSRKSARSKSKSLAPTPEITSPSHKRKRTPSDSDEGSSPGKAPKINETNNGVDSVDVPHVDAALPDVTDEIEAVLPPVVVTTAASTEGTPLASNVASTSEPSSNDQLRPAKIAKAVKNVAAPTLPPTRPKRRIPGRRRAPHSDPRVEAATRYQLHLKKCYREMARAQKAVLDELARRSIEDNGRNHELYKSAPEFPSVTAELQEKVTVKLNMLQKRHEAQTQLLKKTFRAESAALRHTARKEKELLKEDYVARLDHELLTTFKRQRQEEDANDTDEEGMGQVFPSDSWPLIAPATRSSYLAIDDKIDELFTRYDLHQLQYEHDPVQINGYRTAFTVFDQSIRETGHAYAAGSKGIEAVAAAASHIEKTAEANANAVGLSTLADVFTGPQASLTIPPQSRAPVASSKPPNRDTSGNASSAKESSQKSAFFHRELAPALQQIPHSPAQGRQDQATNHHEHPGPSAQQFRGSQRGPEHVTSPRAQRLQQRLVSPKALSDTTIWAPATANNPHQSPLHERYPPPTFDPHPIGYPPLDGQTKIPLNQQNSFQSSPVQNRRYTDGGLGSNVQHRPSDSSWQPPPSQSRNRGIHDGGFATGLNELDREPPGHRSTASAGYPYISSANTPMGPPAPMRPSTADLDKDRKWRASSPSSVDSTARGSLSHRSDKPIKNRARDKWWSKKQHSPALTWTNTHERGGASRRSLQGQIKTNQVTAENIQTLAEKPSQQPSTSRRPFTNVAPFTGPKDGLREDVERELNGSVSSAGDSRRHSPTRTVPPPPPLHTPHAQHYGPQQVFQSPHLFHPQPYAMQHQSPHDLQGWRSFPRPDQGQQYGPQYPQNPQERNFPQIRPNLAQPPPSPLYALPSASPQTPRGPVPPPQLVAAQLTGQSGQFSHPQPVPPQPTYQGMPQLAPQPTAPPPHAFGGGFGGPPILPATRDPRFGYQTQPNIPAFAQDPQRNDEQHRRHSSFGSQGSFRYYQR